jgi:hypothetical protein
MLNHYQAAEFGRQRHQEIIDDVAQRNRAVKILKARSQNENLAGRIRNAVLSVIIQTVG